MEFLQTALKIIGVIILFGFFIVLLIGVALTWNTQHSDLQQKFLAGTVPAALPDGPYRGIVSGYAGSWRGKEFDRAKQGGWNLFENGDKFRAQYPFKLYAGPGLRDRELNVLKIDYNLPQNSPWLKMVTDEIVETSPGHFLGKVHVRLVPGYPFTLGYFELYKETPAAIE